MSHRNHPPRHFVNAYDDSAAPPPALQRRALEQAAAALKSLKRTALEHQDLEGGSIYVGTGGIGLMYYHLASRQWLERSRSAQARRRQSNLSGGGDPTSSPFAAPVDVPAGQVPAYLAKHTPAHALPIAVHFARDGESVMPRRRSSSASGGAKSSSSSGGGGPARVTFLEGYSGLLALESASMAASAALLEGGGGGASSGAAQKTAAAVLLRRSSTGGRSSNSSASGAAGANAPPAAAAQQAQRRARELVSYYAEVVRHLPPGECEVLYGRAGYLYSLLWAQRELDPAGAAAAAAEGGGNDSAPARASAVAADDAPADNDDPQRQQPPPSSSSSSLWPRAEVARVISELVRDIVAAGRQGGAEAAAEFAAEAAAASSAAQPPPPPPPLVWRWHGRRYLGAAHGACGILYALLSCWQHVCAAGCADEVRAGVDGVLALQQKGDGGGGGNLPSSLPDGPGGWASWGGGSDRLVQWCHGAPGFVLLMAKAHEVLFVGGGGGGGGDAAGSSSPYLRAALAAADVVWRRGLLTKGAGSLCHGPSGNGYAFLALWRLTRDPLHLRRARWFAVHAAARLSPHDGDDDEEAEGGYDVADRPASLYEGAAGGVCFVADALLWPDVGCMPGGELLAAAAGF